MKTWMAVVPHPLEMLQKPFCELVEASQQAFTPPQGAQLSSVQVVREGDIESDGMIQFRLQEQGLFALRFVYDVPAAAEVVA